jgi:hypothetical protein
MSQEMLKKTNDLLGTNILVDVKFDVKSQSFSFWGNADCGDRRDLAPVSCNTKSWSLSFGCPSFCDTWNQQKSAFVEEDQISPNPISFFLYGATDNVSTNEWHSRFFPLLSFLVSDNSTQMKSLSSRDCQCNSGHQSVSRLLPQLVLMSIDLWNNLLPEALLPAILATSSFAIPKATKGVLVPVWAEVLFSLSSGKLDASVPQNSEKRQDLQPLNDMSSLIEAELLLFGGASLTPEVYHEVSYLIL